MEVARAIQMPAAMATAAEMVETPMERVMAIARTIQMPVETGMVLKTRTLVEIATVEGMATEAVILEVKR